MVTGGALSHCDPRGFGGIETSEEEKELWLVWLLWAGRISLNSSGIMAVLCDLRCLLI